MCDLLELRVEVVLWRDGAHVAGGGLGDDRRDLTLVLTEGALDGFDVVVRHDDGVRRLRTGYTRRVRQGERCNAGARRRQQRVDVAVVAALELQNLRTAGEAAGEAHSRHGGLGAGVDHAHLIHGRAGDDVLGDLHLSLRRRTEAQAVNQGLLYRLDDLRVGVAVHHRAPGTDEVDVLVAVDVDKLRAVCTLDEAGLAANRAKPAHRRVHPARCETLRALEQFCRTLRIA